MPISSENVLFLYNQSSADSLAFAEYYANFRGLSSYQLIPLPCSGNEILASYAEFQNEIENPLKTALAHEYAVLDPWVIIVGYGVPGGFYVGNSIISTQSRLSRINFAPSWGLSNPLFARAQFQRYDSSDAQQSLIVSRFDAPTLAIAKSMVDNVATVQHRGVANGTFYFNKFAPIDLDEYGAQELNELAYYNDLVYFENTMLPLLNMTTFKTVFWNSTTDDVVPRGIDDSFIWTWKADRLGYSFFETTTKNRIFLYNADTDGGASMRNVDDKRWPIVSLTSGYAATAGAMSDPLPEGYLRPYPFFQALYNGATTGEAFLFACPNLDWTLGMFGDPLIQCRFTTAGVTSSQYSIADGIDRMDSQLQDALGYKEASDLLLANLMTDFTTVADVNTKLDVRQQLFAFVNAYVSETGNIFFNIVKGMETLPGYSLSAFLASNSLQISSQILQIDPSVNISNYPVYDPYSWQFETIIQPVSSSFDTLNFQIQVSLYNNFSPILFSIDSAASQVGWTYEIQPGSFTNIPPSGVTTSYVGRRIKYVAPNTQYFTSRTLYYIRFREYNESAQYSNWVTYNEVVGT